jgi:hypothetical protein
MNRSKYLKLLCGLIVMGFGLTAWVTYACDYDSSQCNWSAAEATRKTFIVPAGGSIVITQDMTHCTCYTVDEGCTAGVVNFQISVLNKNRRWPKANVEVYEQDGSLARRCATFSNNKGVLIGIVPPKTTYYIVVTSGSNRDEECILSFSGSTWGTTTPIYPTEAATCDPKF